MKPAPANPTTSSQDQKLIVGAARATVLNVWQRPTRAVPQCNIKQAQPISLHSPPLPPATCYPPPPMYYPELVQLTFGLPFLLLLLPPVLGLVWWWYRRRKPRERKIAGLWLWQKALRQGKARRKLDLRLLLLLLAAGSILLGLSAPKLSLHRSGALIVVLDASASMAATDVAPSRLEQAKQQAARALERSPRAVLVVAGRQAQAFGPARGSSLLEELGPVQAQSVGSDLEAAIARGKALLPEARVLVVSDAPPPKGADGYINVAGNGQNIGITAVAPGFVALANSGPGPWKGEVAVNGQAYAVEIPAGGFAQVEVPASSFQARIAGSDALALDNQASFSRRLVRVQVSGSSPALERLLGLLGTSRASPAELRLEIGVPRAEPALFTVFFAPQATGQAVVYDLERTLPYLRGAELVGFRLSIPPRPTGPGWRPLAVSTTGEALAWYHPNGLYLPPAETLQNIPAFPVLLYNLIAPRGELREGLLSPAETLLPRPSPNKPLPPTSTLPLAPWLALLAALLLAAEFYFFQYRPRRSPTPSATPST